MRIGLVGQAAQDIVTTARGEDRRLGGSPHYAARALDALGVPWVALTHDGLVSRLDHRDGATAQWIEAVGPPFAADEVVGAVSGCEWVILGGQTAGDFPPDVIDALVAAGHRVFLDGQGLCRGAEAGPVRLRGFAPAAVRGVSILKLGEPEAVAAAGSLAPRDLRRLGAPEVAVTRSAQGALVVTADRVWPIPPTGAGEYADPTGAGDTWAAAYVTARAGGADPPAAGRLAAAHTDRVYL